MNITHESTNTTVIYDAIISGAGPVGMFLACELALASCSVLILEKAESPSSPLKWLPFGVRGLSAPTIESLYRRGLLDELQIHKRLKNPHQNAGQGASRQAGHFAGIPFREGNVDASQWKYRLPSSTAPSLMSEIEELETIFTRRAAALGVTILYGHAITGFQQDDSEVTVQAGNQTFYSQWLAGCDGARSIVRKLGGFDFIGTEPEFTGYTTQMDLADGHKLLPGRNLTERGMYLQSQPGYIMLQDFDGGAFHSADKPLTREHMQEVLRRISGTDVTVTALHTATTWTDRARQATTYRNGRILLAGDAAHIHSPLGGQGLNLGLGDAMNLGWKLAAAIKGTAPDGLLDTYTQERHPIGAQVLDWSRAQVALMRPTPAERALNTIFHDLMQTRDGTTYIAGRVWGIYTHYNLEGAHPLTGHSVPNFELEDGTTIGQLIHDGKGLLLDFTNNPILQNVAGEYAHQIRYITTHAKDPLGINALLIRPDGIIAWATDNEPNIPEFQAAAGTWFITS